MRLFSIQGSHLNQRSFVIHNLIKMVLLSALVGCCGGLGTALFLHLLGAATHARELQPHWIWSLPLIGYLIGWSYKRFGMEVVRGSSLIFEEIHNPRKKIPLRMAPMILLGTVFTHFGGGSAGREGTAIQISSAIADYLMSFFRLSKAERQKLLTAGLSAGFSAAIGAPWAGALFGLEVLQIGAISASGLIESLIAAFVAYGITLCVGVHHSVFAQDIASAFGLKELIFVAAAGLCFGLAARAFMLIQRSIEQAYSRLFSDLAWRAFAGGTVLAGLLQWDALRTQAGLGISHIQEAFVNQMSFFDPVLKTILTALTLGAGFKGGEFIPLVYTGTTLGSALSGIFQLPTMIFAGLGFVAVFAGAANVPLTCALMAMELFGKEIGPYAIIACFASYFVSGHQGIYTSQRVLCQKHQMPVVICKSIKAFLQFQLNRFMLIKKSFQQESHDE